jgi:hypothetical protein
MVLARQRARCPLACRSLGGQVMSEDGRYIISFVRPTHPCIAVPWCFSCTLGFPTVFSDGRIVVPGGQC